MTFSHSCASNIVPLLARLVLGGAFIFAGYEKVFTDGHYSGDEAAVLRGLGVEGSSTPSAWSPDQPSLHFASLSFQDPPADEQEGETDAEDASDQVEGEQDSAPPEATDEPEIIQGDDVVAADGPLFARKLYGVAVAVHRGGLQQYELAVAWATALMELVGGALILVGLFSRIWAFGLACVMAGAFYFTTWPDFSEDPYRFVDGNFDHFFAQVGLFVLALAVFLTGPGAISADRMLFKHGRDEDTDVDLT